MARKNKIKRYGKIYRTHSRSSRVTLLSVIVTSAVVLLLAFFGTIIYEPIYNFLINYSNSSQSPGISEILNSSSSSEPPAGNSSQVASQPPEPVKPVYLTHGLYVQSSELKAGLSDVAKLVAGYKQYNINEIVIDLKNDEGNILYMSDLESVKTAGAQVTNAIDLAQFATIAKSNGIKVTGVISAFRDPIAPRKIKDSSIKYMQTDYNWLDKAAEHGGKPWLNPYSPNARQYIADIANEAVSKGVETIIITNVNFPPVYSLERANFGYDSAAVAKPAILKSFMDNVTNTVKANGGKVMMYASAQELVGGGIEKYGDNPLKISSQIAAVYSPSQFGGKFAVNDFAVDAAAMTPAQIVDVTAKYIAKLLPAQAKILPVVKAGTPEETAAIINALGQNGLNEYVIIV